MKRTTLKNEFADAENILNKAQKWFYENDATATLPDSSIPAWLEIRNTIVKLQAKSDNETHYTGKRIR